jgi:hypothetical protein
MSEGLPVVFAEWPDNAPRDATPYRRKVHLRGSDTSRPAIYSQPRQPSV